MKFGNNNNKKDEPKDTFAPKNGQNYPPEEEKKEKKIDFKGKAINAKESAMKKMLAKHTNGGSSGPN